MNLFRKIKAKITGVTIYRNCNIYNGTVIGKGSKIGAYTEISGAIIGENVTIGAKCFIPKKVTIEDGAWIGPGVFFTHSFPPATEDQWKATKVCRGAKIGANATIGRDSTVGCGSVVTRNIPTGATYVGNPAIKINKEEVTK